MRIAAVDTSTWWCGVALVEGDAPERAEVIAEVGVTVRDSHAVHLVRLFDSLVSAAGWDRDAIDAFAATRGPGSFTGLRIGLGTVQGLAIAASRPAIGIGTLDAMAEAHGSDRAVRVPVIDAGRGELYWAPFDPSESPPRPLAEPIVGPPDALAGIESEPRVVFGPGVGRYRTAIEAVPGVRVAARPRSVAAAVARLAIARLAARDDRAAVDMSPLYVRPPDAIARPRG